MPRRNLYLLWFLGLFCLLCYAQSDPLGRVLVQTLRRIQWRYFEEVDEGKLFEGAVDGMTERLKKDFGDRYTMYVPPGDMGEFDKELNQEFGGLGLDLDIDPKTGQLTVLSPLFGSPASLGGIRANDRIIAIDGEPVKGLSIRQAIKMMKGKIGEPIVLQIKRPKHKNGTKKNNTKNDFEKFDLTLKRDVVKIDTVCGDTRTPDGSWNFMLQEQDEIGYLRITTFTDNTVKEIQHAIDQLQKEGMKGLVIDLRDNPGGYLDSTVEICDMFIDSGTIVTTRGRSHDLFHWFSDNGKPRKFDTRDEFFAKSEGTLDKHFPIAVLINGQSASAAEIFAACLQDHHRAKIIGERSYGKGTVQEILPLGGGRGIIKLTAASYWRPNGKNINRSKKVEEEENGDWGVRPDPGFKVPIDQDTRKIIALTRKRRNINYNEALRIRDAWLQSEFDEKPKNGPANGAAENGASENGAAENGQTKKQVEKKRLPLIDPSTPMIDIDPQLRKAVEWIEGFWTGVDVPSAQ